MPNALRFLVVDDFSTMRRIVCNLLKDSGFTDLEEAEDGSSALTKLRNGNFDFVVCDINMPNVNGLQLLAEVKKDPALKHIPIPDGDRRSTQERHPAGGAPALPVMSSNPLPRRFWRTR